jgi:glutamine synthetase
MGMIESRTATPDPEARKAVLQQEKEASTTSCSVHRHRGHLKAAITLGEVEGALNDGMGFDGSSVTGFNAIEESDMVAIPDPATS